MATQDENIPQETAGATESAEERNQAQEAQTDGNVREEGSEGSEPKTYDETYVKQLREENASWRKRLRDTEEKLKEAKSPEDYETLQQQLADVQAKYDQDTWIAKATRDLPADLVDATAWPKDEDGINNLANVLRKHVVVRKESTEELHGGLDPRNERLDENASPAELAARYNKRTRR